MLLSPTYPVDLRKNVCVRVYVCVYVWREGDVVVYMVFSQISLLVLKVLLFSLDCYMRDFQTVSRLWLL